MAPIMKRLLLGSLGLLLATPACVGGDRSDTGQCPAGETCSPETPSGLQFIGSSLLGAFVVGGPLGTAIGGTQEVELDIEAAIGVYVPLNLAYTVDDDGGAGVRFDHQNGNIVTVRGAGSSSNIASARSSASRARRLCVACLSIDPIASSVRASSNGKRPFSSWASDRSIALDACSRSPSAAASSARDREAPPSARPLDASCAWTS